MAKIDRYCAPGVFDPPSYSQAVKVTGAQTILFLAGQVAYDVRDSRLRNTRLGGDVEDGRVAAHRRR